MKPLVLKTLFIGLTYLFLISLSAQPDQAYTEADYYRDVELFKDLDVRHTYYYSQGKMDSIFFMLDEYMPAAKRAYDFRSEDTTIAVLYKYGKVVYGVAIANYLGEISRGLNMAEIAYEDAWNDPMVNKQFHLATTANVLAIFFGKIGDFEKEIWYKQRSFEVKEKLYPRDHPLLGNQYMHLGSVYFNQQEYKRAEYYFLKAQEIYRKNAGNRAESTTGQIARTYFNEGEKERAFYVLENKIANFEIQNEEYLSAYNALLFNLGILRMQTKEYSKAKECFERIILILNDNPLEYSARNFHVAPGEAYFTFQSSFLPEYAYAYELLGKVEYKLGNLSASIRHYEKSIEYETSFRGENARFLPELQLMTARIYAEKGDFSKAEDQWKKAAGKISPYLKDKEFDFFPSLKDMWLNVDILEAFFIKARIYQLKARHYKQFNNLALTSYLNVESMLQSMTEKIAYGTINLISFKNRTGGYYEEGINFFLDQYEQTKEEKYLNLVFRFMETYKSTILMVSLNTSKARKYYKIPQELLDKERATKVFLSYTQKQLSEEENKGDAVSQHRIEKLTTSVNRYKYTRDSILQILQKKHPEYYQFKYQNKIPDLQEVQVFLRKENRGILEYFLGEKYLFTFLIEADQVRYRVDEIQVKKLRETVDAFLNPLKQPDLGNLHNDFEAFAQGGTELYKLLNLDFLTSGSHSNYLIIPDGFLHLIPFHLLPAREGGEMAQSFQDYPYLFKNFTTSTDYSSSLYILSQDQRRKYQTSYLGFAPLYRNGSTIRGLQEEEQVMWEGRFPLISRDGVDSLQFNRAEVLECAEIFGGQPYIEDQAREFAFKQNARDAGILHLAMHAFLDDVNPLYSRLAFNLDREGLKGEDELLYAYELYNTRLNADLAILSACNTGAGKVTKGEGVMSLSHAFKYAGCPNVVLNFWPANDKSAKDLVVSFARHLKDGKGKAEALNEARKEYLQSAAESDAHPYFWGGLTLIGDDEPIKRAGNEGRHWWIGMVLLGVLLFIGFKKKLKVTV